MAEYVENPDKTDNGEWISAYACDPLIADSEFLMSKRTYAAVTGRNQGGRDVIAYHMRQSFNPGEIDRGGYGTWLGDKKPPSQRDNLRKLMDASLRVSDSFDALLAVLKSAGCAVKRDKHLSIRLPGGKQFIRCKSLGEDYTEEAIRERLSGRHVVAPKTKTSATDSAPAKPNLLIDIQAKIRQGKGLGYERWAKLFNLKEMAKALVFLQERGLADYDILLHRADKKHFDSLGLTKLPAMQTLKTEYATLAAEKKKLYPGYWAKKEEMIALLMAKQNVDCLLGTSSEQTKKREADRNIR